MRSRSVSGFTLVELMVVLLVIVVLTAWAAPSFLAMRNRMTIRAAGEDFMTTLTEARFAAARQSTTISADFTTTASRLPSAVQVVGSPTIGGASSTPGVVRIEPRLGILATAGDAGNYDLTTGDYRLRFTLSAIGQGRLCAPVAAKNPGLPAC